MLAILNGRFFVPALLAGLFLCAYLAGPLTETGAAWFMVGAVVIFALTAASISLWFSLQVVVFNLVVGWSIYDKWTVDGFGTCIAGALAAFVVTVVVIAIIALKRATTLAMPRRRVSRPMPGRHPGPTRDREASPPRYRPGARCLSRPEALTLARPESRDRA
jgi:hypothetical protein